MEHAARTRRMRDDFGGTVKIESLGIDFSNMGFILEFLDWGNLNVYMLFGLCEFVLLVLIGSSLC